jgi:hypothetical protein
MNPATGGLVGIPQLVPLLGARLVGLGGLADEGERVLLLAGNGLAASWPAFPIGRPRVASGRDAGKLSSEEDDAATN